MALEYPACDLCGQTGGILLYAGTPGIESENPALFYSSGRTRQGHFDIVRCSGCGLVRSSPRDDSDTRDQVYSQLQDLNYDKDESNRRLIFQRRISSIIPYAPAVIRCLDIGCSTGLFVDEAARMGWQVTGIDPSEWALSCAKQRTPSAQFIQGTVETLDFPDRSFDVITLWDVLEHVNSPRKVFQKIAPWLNLGGLILVNLPNSGSFEARVYGKYWPMLLREHLWYFSADTLGQLFENTGFELISTRPNKVKYSVRNIGQRLIQYPGLIGGMGRLITRLQWTGKLSLWLSIGEIEAIARIKP